MISQEVRMTLFMDEGPYTADRTCTVHVELHVQARPPSTSSASDYRQLACKWAMVYYSSYRNGMWLVATTIRLPLQFQEYDTGSEDDILQPLKFEESDDSMMFEQCIVTSNFNILITVVKVKLTMAIGDDIN